MKIHFYQCQFVIFSFLLIHLTYSDEEIPDFNRDKPFTTNFGSYSVDKLRDLLVKIDTDRDLHITKDELSDWMVKLSLKELDRQAKSAIDFHDLDKDGKIEWPEMLRTSYGYDEESVERIGKSKDPIDIDNYGYIMEDRQKFQLADLDEDGRLTQEEYKGLLNPSNNAKLMKLTIDKILTAHDKNKDSHMDENEFKLFFYVSENLTETQMEEFTSIFSRYDFNKDRKLSVEELEKWYGPDIKLAANIEANNLILKSDTNDDQILTFEEILSKFNDWKISHATSYGEHIRDEL